LACAALTSLWLAAGPALAVPASPAPAPADGVHDESGTPAPGSDEARQAAERATGERLTMALLSLLGAGFLLVPLALNAGSNEGRSSGPWAARRLRRGEAAVPAEPEVSRDHGRDVGAALRALGARDEAYSEPVFTSFVKKVVEKVLVDEQRARHSLAPYLVPLLPAKAADDQVLASLGLRARKLAFRRHLTALTKTARNAPLARLEVADVQVVRATTSSGAGGGGDRPWVRATVEVTLVADVRPSEPDEAGGADDADRTELPDRLRVVRESWTFQRAPDAPSRSPAELLRLGCPSCDRPWDETAQTQTNGRCPACDARVRSPLRAGDFDWVLVSVRVPKHSEPWLPPAESNEVGTDLPSVIDPQLGLRHQQLQTSPAGFEWAPFTQEVRELHSQIYGGTADPTIVTAAHWRGLANRLTEAGLAAEAARASFLASQRLTETVTAARVCSLQLVGVERDRFYDAVTVRVYAAGYFAVVRDLDEASASTSGTVVSGSRHQERVYSEYWTFLREREADRGPTIAAGATGFRLAHRRADEAERAPT
jgi:predicted lipid-binding transport protein (Tim44 family)